MQLDEIRLTHFKCFKEAQVQCSKVTLLTGANSSGKSSILYGLLGAIQTKDFPLYFSPNGNYVSMGDFEELAYNHSARQPFGVGFSIKDGENSHFITDSTYSANPKTKLPKLQTLKYVGHGFSLRVSRANNKFSAEFNYEPEKDPEWKFSGSDDFKQAMLGIFKAVENTIPTGAKKDKKRGTPQQMVEKMFKFQRRGSFTFVNATDLEKERRKRWFVSKQMLAMSATLRKFDEDFNFISSFRLSPERTYYQKTKAALKVDKFGDNAIDQILEWEHSKSKKLIALRKALRTLELAHELRSQKYTGGRFDIRVVPADSELPSSLCDVGFGVSQFLPILVADLQLNKGSTLMVSQPEIHLHPSVQANLADYFCGQTSELGKRYILETHSEYLINRFRLLVAKGKLKEEDVSVYYMGWKAGKPTPHRIVFKKNGQISGAPKDFFSTYMMDVMDIAMNS
jgi:predicted ATPase